MNALGITLVWCAVQVTVLAALAVGFYLVACRRRPARAASLLTAGILAVLAVSGLALSPWPNWVTFSDGRPASDYVTSEPQAPASGQDAAPSNVLNPTLARSNGGVDDKTFDRDHTFEQSFGWSASLAAALRGELDRTRTSDSVSHWRWPATLAVLAVVGALLMLLRLGFGLWLVQRYRKESTPLDGTEIDALLAHLVREMNLRRPVVLRESAAIATPATLGWLRPTILLPPAWVDWSDDERRAVLSHELAHVEAGDYLTGIVAEFARALHFYNPLVRWMASRLRLEQELAADATAALSVGSKDRYLESLARLAIKNDDPPVALLVRPFLPRRGTLLRRIDMLRSTMTTTARWPNGRFFHAFVAVAATVLALAVAGMRLPAADSGLNRDDATAKRADSAPETPHTAQAPEDTEAEPLPEGVVRVFGTGRLRTWGYGPMALSPDGKTLAVGDHNHIRLFDWKTGRLVKVIKTEHGGSAGIAFSPDGELLAVGGNGGKIEVWNVARDERLQRIEADTGAVGSVAFTHDGTRLVSGGADGSISVWDPATGKRLKKWQAHEADRIGLIKGLRLAISPDDKYVISGSDYGIVKLSDLSIGATVRSDEVHTQLPSTYVGGVAFSPDGRYRASCGWDGKIKIWEHETHRLVHDLPGNKINIYPYHEMRSSICFDPSGKRLAIGRWEGYETVIELRDVETGQIIGTLSRHLGNMWTGGGAILFSNDGKYLFSTTDDRMIKVWDLSTMREYHEPTVHRRLVQRVQFSPDGKTLATATEDGRAAHLWDVETGRHLGDLPFPLDGLNVVVPGHRVWDLSFSRDARLLAAASTPRAKIWDLTTREVLLEFRDHEEVWCSRVSFSPEREWLAVGGKKGVSVWTVPDKRRLFSADHDGGQWVAMAPNGTFYALGDKGLKAWDVANNRELFELADLQRPIDISANGELIAARRKETPDNQIHLFNAKTGDEVAVIESPHSPIQKIRFDPVGHHLASVGYLDNKVSIWDPAKKGIRHTWEIGYGFSVVDLSFSPDGRYLATANMNGTAYLLEVPGE